MPAFSRAYTRFVSGCLFPLQETLKGHDSPRILKEMEKTQWLDEAALSEYRLKKLRTFLSYVGQHVPYYKKVFQDTGFNPELIGDITDIRVLPIMDKASIRSAGDSLLSDTANGLQTHTTSGSTGEPLKFYLDNRRISHDIAAKWRGMRWWDVDIGDKELVLWSAPIENQSQTAVKRIRDRLFRSELIPSNYLDQSYMEVLVKKIINTRPVMLFGYPSVIYQIARYAQEKKLQLGIAGIQVIFVTSEILDHKWKNTIEETFNCPVANEYGARDAGLIAKECPHGGLHITAEALILEVVDEQGKPVADGDMGEVLISNISGVSYPFIRYRTGDMAVMESSQCPCGRSLPTIRAISGRANDLLVATNGAKIHGSTINYLMKGIDAIAAYRVIQENPEHCRIELVCDSADTGVEMRLTKGLKEYLGEDMELEYIYKEIMTTAHNGKYKHIVNNLS